MAHQIEEADVDLSVRNIGGISSASGTIPPGLTTFTGENATNRTSLLRALGAALGSEQVSLKSDAEEGQVTLSIAGEEYTRKLISTPNGVGFEGDPYTDDQVLLDLFVLLFRDNECRRAAEAGRDLREIIMRPVDLEDLQTEIASLQDRRDELQQDLEHRRDLKQELPKLEEQRTQLTEDIEELSDKIAEKDAKLAEFEKSGEAIQEVRDELEERMGDLQDVRDERERLDTQIENTEEKLEAARGRREEIAEELEGMEVVDKQEFEMLEEEITRLRSQRSSLSSLLNQLDNVIQFNEEHLQGDSSLLAELSEIEGVDNGSEDEKADPTQELLADSEGIRCWTCGSLTTRNSVNETLDRLQQIRKQKYSEVEELKQNISELQDERRELEQQQERQEELSTSLEEIESKIDSHQSQLEELESLRDEAETRVDELEASVEELRDQQRSEYVDTRTDLSELERKQERKKTEKEQIVEQINDHKSRTDEIPAIEAEINDIQDEIVELRDRVEQIERDSIEKFNKHMEELIDRLDYQNLSRVWLERLVPEEKAGDVSESVFELHIIREDEEGVAYEDDFANLSESEREVVGIVLAFAGYLAHDVHEEIPFLVLDSLEAIDSRRIANMLEYMSRAPDYFVVALLEEDAEYVESTEVEITSFTSA